MSITAMKQALEALKSYHGYMEPLTTVFGGPRVPAEQSTTGKVEKAITSLRQAIAEAEKQKPYGWAYESHGRFTCNAHPIFWKTRKAETHTEDFWEEIPLYRSPQPKREPLTFEQVEDCFPEGAIFAEQDGWLCVSAQTLHDIARNIEAAHGIKENT